MIVGLALITGKAQVNGGFEQWNTTAGYEDLTGWRTTNGLQMLGVGAGCIKNTQSHYGNYSAKLVPVKFDFFGDTVVIPGAIMQQIPYSLRPKSVNIYYQNLSKDSDSAYISVQFFKGPTQDTGSYIGGADAMMDRQRNWTKLSVDIDWLNGQNPDTMIISIVGAGGDKDTLLVDDLSLSFWGTDISTVVAEKAPVLFKNSLGDLMVTNYSPVNESKIIIRNAMGQIVYETSVTGDSIHFKPGASGIYFYEITDAVNRYTGKLVY